MDVELGFDSTTRVSHFDANGVVPVGGWVALFAPNGKLLAQYEPTWPTWSQTVADTSTTSKIVVASTTGLRGDDRVCFDLGGYKSIHRVSSIDGTSFEVEPGLPSVPVTGSTVSALMSTADIEAQGAGQIGSGFRLQWHLIDADDAVTEYSYEASVVRWRWEPPVTASTIQSILSAMTVKRSRAYLEEATARANDKIYSALLQVGRRPHLFLASGVFIQAGQVAARWVLAEDGITQGDVWAAQRELRFSFGDEMTKAVASALAYDADASGGLSPEERKPMHFSIRMSR